MFQSDFSGRVVNNDHFLYWGETYKTSEDGVDFQIQVKNGLSPYGGRAKNGLEVNTLDGHNSATEGRRMLRFYMSQFKYLSLSMPSLIKI